MATFELAGRKVAAGERSFLKLPVTHTLWGQELYIPAHVLNGVKDGPTLCLLALSHGAEYPPVRAFRQVWEQVDERQLSGALVILPVANPLAFVANCRIAPEQDIDFANMNRVFPGRRGKATFGGGDAHESDRTLTEMTASVLVDQVFPRITHFMDYHCHHDGNVLAKILAKKLDGPLGEQSLAMARAFGFGLIHLDSPGPKTASGLLASMNVPACSPEVGGAEWGGSLERLWTEQQARGTLNVMKHLGMLPGEMQIPSRQLVYHNAPKVRPSKGGYLVSEIEAEEIYAKPDFPGVEVKKGQLLGTIFDPYSFAELERLYAPCDGICYMARRSGPAEAGSHAYGIASTTEACEWIS